MREGREGSEGAPVVVGHGEHNSGEVTVMATASELAKGPHLRLVWLRENVDEVRGVLVELCES